MKHFKLLLAALFIGGLTTLCGQPQYPPSQRELNGFLLGEDAKPLSEVFDSLIKEQKYGDGWIDRVYSLDSTGASYMVFGFSDSSDDCMSIQITGNGSTAMHPFLGLRLGDSRQRVMEILGTPSQVQHLHAPPLEFLLYARRNYSIELDSLGNLCSIRILGYRGFADTPSDSLPNLENIFQLLKSSDPEIILEALAPDVEVIAGDSIYTFSGSALDVIADQSSLLSQFLYSGQTSLASLSASTIRSATLDPESAKKNNATPEFKFSGSSPVKDIVFVVHAGKWRIWETHLSR
jgi:hypothetical protein